MTNDSNYWGRAGQQQAQPQAQPASQLQGQPQAQPVQQPVQQAQPQPQPASQAQPEQQQPQAQAQPVQQPVSQAQSQAQAQPQPTKQPASQAQPQQQQQPQPVQQPASQPQAQPQPQPQARQQGAPQPPTYQAPPAPAFAYGNAYQYQMPVQQQQKSKRWIIPVVIIVCLFLFTAFSVKMCTDAVGSLSATSGGTGAADIGQDSIGVINIDGTIQYDGSLCSPEGLKEMLDDAEANSHIKAIVLRVNSGGGTATAGEEMAEYLRQFKKPVVVSSASINASAAYEISSQADYIYVARSTEIGAIGTVMEMTDLSGLFEKLGINMETIASAESKDSSYGYRPLTDEERAYYQKMVNQINDMFVENVAQGRKMKVDDVRKLATGLVFTGADAVENGLADAIGTREDAVAKAAELAGVTSYETVDLHFNDYDFTSLAYLLGESNSSADELIDLLKAEKSGQQSGHTK